MAVTDVKENGFGWESSKSTKKRDRSRTDAVQLDAVPTSPVSVETATDGSVTIPLIGAAHPDDAGATAVRLSCVPRDEDVRMLWDVTVVYTTSSANVTPEPEDDPTDDPWAISWGVQTEEKLIAVNRTNTTSLTAGQLIGLADGAALLNAAGDIFDPPPSEPSSLLVCTLVKNKSAYDVSQADNYIDTMNSDSVTIAGHSVLKWEAKLIEYSGVQKFDRGGYWTITYRVLFNVGTHIRAFLNAGYQKIDDVSGYKIPLKLKDGSVTARPEVLEINGEYDPASRPTPSYYMIGSLDELTFSSLSLPTTM